MVVWLRQGVLFLHLLAAVFWIGEILFVSAVLGPLAERLPSRERAELLRTVGRLTLPWVWTAVSVLVVTGLANLYLLGIRPQALWHAALYRTAFGWLLAAKLFVALGMIVHAAVQDFVYGRRTRLLRARLAAAPPAERPALQAAYARARRRARAVGRANLVLALLMLALAAGVMVRT